MRRPQRRGGFLTTRECAAALGVSPPTLRKWKKQGCPCDYDDHDALAWDLGAVRAWMAENGITGKPGRKRREVSEGEPVDPKERKLYWDARKAKVAAMKAEGAVVDRQEVERDLLAKIAAVRNGLLSQPARYAPRLLACSTVRELTAEWTEINRELLYEFAGDAVSGRGGEGDTEGTAENDEGDAPA